MLRREARICVKCNVEDERWVVVLVPTTAGSVIGAPDPGVIDDGALM